MAGPVVAAIPYIIAGVQLAISLYGAWKGQQASEAAAKAEAARRANLKRLAIKKFKHQQGTAAWNISNLDRQEQRERDIEKTDFLVKRLETHAKQESVIRGLRTARINMEYGIAGLTAPSTPDRSLMYLQMANAGLDAYGTYHKYTTPKVDPNIYGYDTNSSVYGIEDTA